MQTNVELEFNIDMGAGEEDYLIDINLLITLLINKKPSFHIRHIPFSPIVDYHLLKF